MIDSSAFAVVGIAVVVFATTNIDDVFLLSAFFADPRLSTRSVVTGQFAGIATLVVASAVAALTVLAVPEGWVALLGFVPLGLGINKLSQVRRGTDLDDVVEDLSQLREQGHGPKRHALSQIVSVMGVTIANGGDNLSVYVPLFASDLRLIPAYGAVFALLTGVWCAIGYGLVNNPLAGQHVRRYGHVALPFVLISLGIYILLDAVVLLP